MVVNGIDMDGAATGPLRLWRYASDDMTAGNIYILRGLKVVAKTVCWGDL